MYANRKVRALALSVVLSTVLLTGRGAAQGRVPAPPQLSAQALVGM